MWPHERNTCWGQSIWQCCVSLQKAHCRALFSEMWFDFNSKPSISGKAQSSLSSPSIPIPSDSSAHESLRYLLPSPKKPNHRSKEIKCGFWRSRCFLHQPEVYQHSRKWPWVLCRCDGRLKYMRPRSAACLLPGSQALLYHLVHGYARTHRGFSHAILPGTFSSGHSSHDCQGLSTPVFLGICSWPWTTLEQFGRSNSDPEQHLLGF